MRGASFLKLSHAPPFLVSPHPWLISENGRSLRRRLLVPSTSDLDPYRAEHETSGRRRREGRESVRNEEGVHVRVTCARLVTCAASQLRAFSRAQNGRNRGGFQRAPAGKTGRNKRALRAKNGARKDGNRREIEAQKRKKEEGGTTRSTAGNQEQETRLERRWKQARTSATKELIADKQVPNDEKLD